MLAYDPAKRTLNQNNNRLCFLWLKEIAGEILVYI
jgi:hypothetical protein